jgi:hypothetical protein
MSRSPEILIWDSSTCQSQTIDFIPQLQRLRPTAFSSIVVIAPEPATIPPSLGDLAITLPVTIRLGPNALYDGLLDAISFFQETNGQAAFVIITAALPLWITLLQRLEPKSVAFVSSTDPSQCLEFSFLPATIAVQTYSWPDFAPYGASDAQVSRRPR